MAASSVAPAAFTRITSERPDLPDVPKKKEEEEEEKVTETVDEAEEEGGEEEEEEEPPVRIKIKKKRPVMSPQSPKPRPKQQPVNASPPPSCSYCDRDIRTYPYKTCRRGHQTCSRTSCRVAHDQDGRCPTCILIEEEEEEDDRRRMSPMPRRRHRPQTVVETVRAKPPKRDNVDCCMSPFSKGGCCRWLMNGCVYVIGIILFVFFLVKLLDISVGNTSVKQILTDVKEGIERHVGKRKVKEATKKASAAAAGQSQTPARPLAPRPHPTPKPTKSDAQKQRIVTQTVPNRRS